MRNNEPDSLSQSVTVNTRVAIDLVQQMWNSPCAGNIFKLYCENHYWTNYFFYIDKDEEPELISRDRKPILFDAFEEVDNNIKPCPSDFMVYEDNQTPIDNNVFKAQQKELVRKPGDFYVYTDDNDQAKTHKEPTVFVDHNDENQVENNEIQVYIDKNDKNNKNGFKIPDVYVDNDDENVFSKKSSKINQFMRQTESTRTKIGSKIEVKKDKNSEQPNNVQNYKVYEDEIYDAKKTEKQVNNTKHNSINPNYEDKSPFKKIQNVS